MYQNYLPVHDTVYGAQIDVLSDMFPGNALEEETIAAEVFFEGIPRVKPYPKLRRPKMEFPCAEEDQAVRHLLTEITLENFLCFLQSSEQCFGKDMVSGCGENSPVGSVNEWEFVGMTDEGTWVLHIVPFICQKAILGRSTLCDELSFIDLHPCDEGIEGYTNDET